MQWLYNLADTILDPSVMKEETDYMFLEGQSYFGIGLQPNELIGQELPETIHIDWLGSILDPNGGGCFAWKI